MKDNFDFSLKFFRKKVLIKSPIYPYHTPTIPQRCPPTPSPCRQNSKYGRTIVSENFTHKFSFFLGGWAFFSKGTTFSKNFFQKFCQNNYKASYETKANDIL